MQSLYVSHYLKIEIEYNLTNYFSIFDINAEEITVSEAWQID